MVEDLTVRDVMTRDYVGVSESDSVQEVAELMLNEGESAIVVMRGSEAVGFVRERQLLRTFLDGSDPKTTRIDAIMERPTQMLQTDQRVDEAVAVLADAETDHVCIMDEQGLVGLLSENDVITAVMSFLSTESSDDAITFESENHVSEVEGTMTAQSVCEVCGSLRAELENVNGQLICTDCRSI